MILKGIAIPKAALRVGPLDPGHRIGFTVVLAAKAPLPPVHPRLSARQHSKASTHQQSSHLTHAELRQKCGVKEEAAELIESFARKFNLDIVEEAAHRRSMRLAGSAADIARAFKTRFEEFELNGHLFFAHTQPLHVPEAWNGSIESVIGLHSSRQAWPRRGSSVHGRATSAHIQDLSHAYRFPPNLDGSGQTIGIIEFGGGFHPKDIEQFCAHNRVAAPRITVVKIGSGANRPASHHSVNEFLDVISGTLTLAAKEEQSDPFLDAQCTAEVTMDLEILAALVPAAHIVVYFASSDEQGLYHAISHAVHDEHYQPGILSISWSMPERTLSGAELKAVEGVLREAAHLGITVCASSGDAGALNGSADGKPSVNYPASSPHCLGCGGTSGKISPSGISEEIVWNAIHFGIKGASGGGVSSLFPLPEWQQGARVPIEPRGKRGRGVPDVAGLADPRYGCEMMIAGRTFASAGTSSVAPMWAALIARFNQALGRRCGHLHPHIYRLGKDRATALRPVLKGDNGLYRAGRGWNACTGYGTPRGDALLAYLRDSPNS
ncbi:MAG TPA: S53 family peptidase [Silvibacterium sp.]|nr:S53 family peptidase [Silvibacterium sp.]